MHGFPGRDRRFDLRDTSLPHRVGLGAERDLLQHRIDYARHAEHFPKDGPTILRSGLEYVKKPRRKA